MKATGSKVLPLWIALICAIGETILSQVLSSICPHHLHFYCSCDANKLAALVPVKMCLYQQYAGISCHPCHNHLQDYVNCHTCAQNVCPICSSQIFGLNASHNTGYSSEENLKAVFFRFSEDRNGFYYLPPSSVYNVQTNENELMPSNSSDNVKKTEIHENNSVDTKIDQNILFNNKTHEIKEVIAQTRTIYDHPNLQDAELLAEKFPVVNLPDLNLQNSFFPLSNLQASNYPSNFLFDEYQPPIFPSGNYPASNLQASNSYASNFPNAYPNNVLYTRLRRDIGQKVAVDDANEDKMLKYEKEIGKNSSNQRKSEHYLMDSKNDSVYLNFKLPSNVSEDKYGVGNNREDKKENMGHKLLNNVSDGSYGVEKIGKDQKEKMVQPGSPLILFVLESIKDKLEIPNKENYEPNISQESSNNASHLNSSNKAFEYQESGNKWDFKTSENGTKFSKIYVLNDHSSSFNNSEILSFKNHSRIENLNRDKNEKIKSMIDNEDFIKSQFYQNYDGNENLKYSKKSNSSDYQDIHKNRKAPIYLEDRSNITYTFQNVTTKSNLSFQNTPLISTNLSDLANLLNGTVRNKCTISDIQTLSITHFGNTNVIPGYEFMCIILKKSNKMADINSNSLMTNENESNNSETFFSRKELLPLVEDILRCLLDQEKKQFTIILNELKVDLSKCQFTILPNFIMKLLKNYSEINFEDAETLQKSQIQKFKIIQTLFSTVQLEIKGVINYINTPTSNFTTLKDAKRNFSILSGYCGFEMNLLLQSNLSSKIYFNHSLQEMNIEIKPTNIPIKNNASHNNMLLSDFRSKLRFLFFGRPVPLLNSSDPERHFINDEWGSKIPMFYQSKRKRNPNSLYGKESLPYFTLRKQMDKDDMSNGMPVVSYYRIFFDLNKDLQSNKYSISSQSRKTSNVNETEFAISNDELQNQSQTNNRDPIVKILNPFESEPDINSFNFFNLPTIDNILSVVSTLFSLFPFHSSTSGMGLENNYSPNSINISNLLQIKYPENRKSIFNKNIHDKKRNRVTENYILFPVENSSESNKMLIYQQMQDNVSLDHDDFENLPMTNVHNKNVKVGKTKTFNELINNTEYVNLNSTDGDFTSNTLNKNLSDKKLPKLEYDQSIISFGGNDAENHLDGRLDINKTQIESKPYQKYVKNEGNKISGTESKEEKNENKFSFIILEENHTNGSVDLLSPRENPVKRVVNDLNTSENEISHEVHHQKRRLFQIDDKNVEDAENVIAQIEILDSKHSRSKRSFNPPENYWCPIDKRRRNGNLHCLIWTYKKECTLSCHPGYVVGGATEVSMKCNKQNNIWQPKMEACAIGPSRHNPPHNVDNGGGGSASNRMDTDEGNQGASSWNEHNDQNLEEPIVPEDQYGDEGDYEDDGAYYDDYDNSQNDQYNEQYYDEHSKSHKVK